MHVKTMRRSRTGDILRDEKLFDAPLVGCLVQEVQLGVEAYGPLVEQRDVVGALLRREPVHEALVDFRRPPEHVEVLRDAKEGGSATFMSDNCVESIRQYDINKQNRRGKLRYFKDVTGTATPW